MRRLTAEYNWRALQEDLVTWATFAAQYDIDLFVWAIGDYMTDTTEVDGKPACTFRPRVGEILSRMQRHVEASEQARKAEETKERYKDLNDGTHCKGESLERHMQDIRQQPWFRRYQARKGAL